MVKDFASLIDRYGFIPNGTRSYYLSRSQPPFFARMVELVAERDGESSLVAYLPQLQREYAFWMDGEAALARGNAHRRLVRFPDGSLLNRYWDDRDTPRDEAYREDVETARSSPRPAPSVYREIRAAAESGWDFSSRWLADGKTLATIHTTDLVPPDLNSLLYQLELTIARGCAASADRVCADRMQVRAAARKRAIGRYLWNDAVGAFTDYDWRRQRKGDQLTAAALFPLFLRASTPVQARSVAVQVRSKLLLPGGLATTAIRTGQQWDAPNGWAPLHWAAVQGLRNYGETALATAIAERWAHTNLRVFRAAGKLVEKYDLSAAAEGSGGEYPLQDGFGWTNGVLRKLLNLYPQLAPSAEADATRPSINR
jgi:alpha,alpha-trehalase